MKLYYAPNSRAHRPRWLLEEMEVPYELVRVDLAAKENRQPSYLQVHPLGLVPALVDGETTLFESAAICLYLADKFPEKRMAPPVGMAQRGLYYQWVIFAVTTFEPPVATYDDHTKRLPPEQRLEAVAQRARQRLDEVAGVLERAVTGREYLVGDHFTVADLMISAVVGWARSLGVLVDRPALLDYSKRHANRPAAKRARAA